MLDQSGNFRPRYVIVNKEHGVEEVVLDILHVIDAGLEQLEDVTYPPALTESQPDLFDLGRPNQDLLGLNESPALTQDEPLVLDKAMYNAAVLMHDKVRVLQFCVIGL